MKKMFTFIVCLLIATAGWILALHPQILSWQDHTKVSVLTPEGRTTKQLHLRGNKTHRPGQRIVSGTRAYRRVGHRVVRVH